MKSLLPILATILLLSPALDAYAQAADADPIIAAATAPLPDEYRAGAAVWTWQSDGSLSQLRQGSNEMVCLADDPSDDRFHVACYHASLEPFMERGRALRREGKSQEEVREIRESEARDGKLAMPNRPAALYSLSGALDAVDPETGAVSDASKLYVVYLPYATEAETGLSTVPAPGKPWLMDPGKPWAHIMLFPPDADAK